MNKDKSPTSVGSQSAIETKVAALMASIPDRPSDSTAADEYKIGDKVYYLKGGKMTSLTTLLPEWGLTYNKAGVKEL